MRAPIFLSTLLLPAVLVAQDWALFPLGQRSWFRYTAGWNGPAISMHLMDSVKPAPDGAVLYFRRSLDVPGAAGCTSELLATDFYTAEHDPDPIDSLFVRNDTVFFHHHEVNEPFLFLPKAGIGQSWTITSSFPGNTYDQITITCASIEEETFFGLTDSVRTFTMEANGSIAGQTPVSDFTMRLSKHHGLLQLVPFNSFLIHPGYVDFMALPLVGFEHAAGGHGFTQPGFHDYFHPEVGDILLWEEDFVPPSIEDQPWTRYRRDSITSVSITADTVQYSYDRTTLMETGALFHNSGLTTTFTRAVEGQLVENAPHRPYVDQDHLVWYNGPLYIGQHPVTFDSIITIRLNNWGHYLQPDPCEVFQMTDGGEDLELNTLAGLVRSCIHFSSGHRCNTLIGWRMDGLTYNDIALGAMELPLFTEGFTLAPNPVSSHLELKGLRSMGPVRYEIIDASGATVGTGRLEGNMVGVSSLKPGMYVLHLHSGQATTQARFVKE